VGWRQRLLSRFLLPCIFLPTMIRWTRIRCGTLVSCPYNTPLIHLPGLR
jgi:hypothetical protein